MPKSLIALIVAYQGVIMASVVTMIYAVLESLSDNLADLVRIDFALIFGLQASSRAD